MFRNQYDTDVTIWSPEGRLLQVEYAMESVKQGSVCIGLRSNTHVILGALKRSPSLLSSYQKKKLEIDNHIGIAVSGLTADARSLAKYMRNESMNYKYVYGTPIPTHVLMNKLSDKHQRTTQTYVRRPYGVGLLVASYDKNGPHLHQTCPSGNVYEYYATAIGARSQSARTYLEKIYQDVKDEEKDVLILHVLKALSSCISGNEEVKFQNGSISIVGNDEDFHIVEGEDLKEYLDRLGELDDTKGSDKIVEDIEGKRENSDDERNNKENDEDKNEVKDMET